MQPCKGTHTHDIAEAFLPSVSVTLHALLLDAELCIFLHLKHISADRAQLSSVIYLSTALNNQKLCKRFHIPFSVTYKKTSCIRPSTSLYSSIGNTAVQWWFSTTNDFWESASPYTISRRLCYYSAISFWLGGWVWVLLAFLLVCLFGFCWVTQWSPWILRNYWDAFEKLYGIASLTLFTVHKRKPPSQDVLSYKSVWVYYDVAKCMNKGHL